MKVEELAGYLPNLRLPRWPNGEESTCRAEDTSLTLGQEDPLVKEMATHSSILVRRIPQTEELGKLQSMGVTESDMTY